MYFGVMVALLLAHQMLMIFKKNGELSGVRRPYSTLKATLWLNRLISGQKVFFENVCVAEDSL